MLLFIMIIAISYSDTKFSGIYLYFCGLLLQQVGNFRPMYLGRYANMRYSVLRAPSYSFSYVYTRPVYHSYSHAYVQSLL